MAIDSVSEQDSAMEMHAVFPIDEEYYRSVNAHRRLLLDRERVRVYKQAIQNVLEPGDIVADIGTGTGLLAFFCVQAGASHVYAVERTSIITLAAQIAMDNDMKDCITFIRGDSLSTRLPTRVDLVVSEMVGDFGLEEGILPTLIDARQRFLKPGGKIIPGNLSLYLAPMELPHAHAGLEFDASEYGLSFETARRGAMSNVYLLRVNKNALLAKPGEIASIAFVSQEDVSIIGMATFRIARKGILHGLCGWHRLTLTRDISLSNCPGSRFPSSWKQCFFPVAEPIPLHEGDQLDVAFESHSDSKVGDVWCWTVTAKTATAPVRSSRHSTALGLLY